MSEPSARLTSMPSYGIRSKITWATRWHVTFLVDGGVHSKRYAAERAFLQKLTASQLSCSLRPTATDTPAVLHIQAPRAAWMCACLLSHVRLFVTPWTVALKASLSTKFSRQEYWSGLPFPSPRYLFDPGIKLVSLACPALAGGFFTS